MYSLYLYVHWNVPGGAFAVFVQVKIKLSDWLIFVFFSPQTLTAVNNLMSFINTYFIQSHYTILEKLFESPQQMPQTNKTVKIVFQNLTYSPILFFIIFLLSTCIVCLEKLNNIYIFIYLFINGLKTTIDYKIKIL